MRLVAFRNCLNNIWGGILVDELIKNMLKYDSGKASMDILLDGNYLENVDRESFNVMIIDVLSWLRLGYQRELWKKEKRYVKQKPLDINLKYPWCKILKELTETNPRFHKYFFTTDKKFDFRETVTEEERVNAMKLVYDTWSMKIIT